MGQFILRHIADELQKFGYVPDDVLGATNYLLRKQLISADHMNYRCVTMTDSVRILASGFMHLRILPERIEYLYGVLPTTPLLDKSIVTKISDVLLRENMGRNILGTDKATVIRLLRTYLVVSKN